MHLILDFYIFWRCFMNYKLRFMSIFSWICKFQNGMYYIPLCSKLDALGHQCMFLCYARLECTDHMYVVCLFEWTMHSNSLYWCSRWEYQCHSWIWSLVRLMFIWPINLWSKGALIGMYGLHFGLLFARMYIYGLNFGLLCSLMIFMNCKLKTFNLCVQIKFFLRFCVGHPTVIIGQRMFKNSSQFLCEEWKIGTLVATFITLKLMSFK